ncbi:MAG TPA: hypothetical protein VFO79_14970 [Xanthomonadales bacterium]|nr:hypothetical protein [Xanthomonadales bacterium]
MLAVGALGLALAALVPWLQGASRRRLAQAHRGLLGGGRVFEAAHIGAAELDGPMANPMQRAWRGHVVVEPGRARFVGARRHGGEPVTLVFDRERHRATLFRRSSTVVGLPTMVRISDGVEPRFLFVDGGLGGARDAETEALFRALRDAMPATSTDPVRAGLPPALATLAWITPVLLLAALAVWSSYVTSAVRGPRLVASGEGIVVVVRADDLLRFDQDGKETARVALDALGIEDGASDVRIDSADEVLLADTAAGVVRRCRISARSCDVLDGLPDIDGPFAFVRAPGGLVVAESGARRVRLGEDDLPGAARGLCNPRGLALASDGRIVLADSGHFRLLAWDASGAPPTAHPTIVSRSPPPACRARKESIEPLPIAQRGGVAPLALAQAEDGRWWVAAGEKRLRNGDVLLLDRDFAPVAAAELPEHADPASVAPLGADMLVADPRRHTIYRFDRDGRRLDDFAAAVWARERMPGEQGFAFAFRIAPFVLAALLAVVVALLAFASVARRRRIRELLRA